MLIYVNNVKVEYGVKMFIKLKTFFNLNFKESIENQKTAKKQLFYTRYL